MSILLEHVDHAIVVALPLEARPLRQKLTDPLHLRTDQQRITLGKFGTQRIALIEAGVGQTAAQQATRIVIDGHHPKNIIAAGICGGLSPQLSHNAIVIPQEIGKKNNTSFQTVPTMTEASHHKKPVEGLLITEDSVACTIEEKEVLNATTGAIAVDMESWWIAQEAIHAGIPWSVIRTVSDVASETISSDVAALASIKTTSRQAGTALRMAWKRPSILVELAELRENAHQAASALAAYLFDVLKDDTG